MRITFDKNATTGAAEVVQEDEYYAYGLRSPLYDNSNGNRHLYNGKELQTEINQYDYGARFYDPVIARWTVIDPLAESDRRWSPYNYATNNPMRNIDPDGMDIVRARLALWLTYHHQIIGKRLGIRGRETTVRLMSNRPIQIITYQLRDWE